MLNGTAQAQELGEGYRNRRDELEYYVAKLMQPEIDYLPLEQSNRLCLLKPGAEKLCELYHLTPQYELVQATSSNLESYVMYVVKAVLRSEETGLVAAEGLGLASSQESQYGQKRSMDIANTILKMAKKRALVDAVLSAVGGSFLFTQDLEDMRTAAAQPTGSDGVKSKTANQENRQRYENYQKNNHSQKQSQNRNTGRNQSSGKGYGNQNPSSNRNSSTTAPTDKQIHFIEELMSKRHITIQQMRSELDDRFGVQDYRQLNRHQASEFIGELKEMEPWAS